MRPCSDRGSTRAVRFSASRSSSDHHFGCVARDNTPLRKGQAVSSAELTARQPHIGLPPLDQRGPPLSFFEFWPQQIFYAPMVLYWLWLSLRHGGFTLPT